MMKKWAPVRGLLRPPFLAIMTEAIRARTRAYPMTYKIGTIGEFKEWTMQVVKDPAAATSTPKRWFDSEETATKAMERESQTPPDGDLVGPESVVSVERD